MFGRLFPDAQQQRQICDLYSSGQRLIDVQSHTGYCTTTIKKVLKLNGKPSRKRGTRLGTGPIQSFDDTVWVDFKGRWDKLDSTVKGSIAETHVATRLSELGFDVWTPFCQNHKTDLFVVLKAKLVKIQVKSATYDLKTKAFRANVTRHRRDGRVTQYAVEDVDFFIVYCGGFDAPTFYVTPAIRVIGRSDMKLYPHRKKETSLAPLGAVNWEEFKNAFDLIC